MKTWKIPEIGVLTIYLGYKDSAFDLKFRFFCFEREIYYKNVVLTPTQFQVKRITPKSAYISLKQKMQQISVISKVYTKIH